MYRREDYLQDLYVFLKHLGLKRCVLLGHSLGGVNAYQFAARENDLVAAMIIEDIGVVIQDDADFVLGWAGTFPSRESLELRVGEKMLPYLRDSFRKTAEGWRLAFDPKDMVASQAALNGDYWGDWCASTCPALLIRGAQSPLTDAAELKAMAATRANTRLLSLDGGHVVHVDSPRETFTAIKSFLQEI
jgi:esterase